VIFEFFKTGRSGVYWNIVNLDILIQNCLEIREIILEFVLFSNISANMIFGSSWNFLNLASLFRYQKASSSNVDYASSRVIIFVI